MSSQPHVGVGGHLGFVERAVARARGMRRKGKTLDSIGIDYVAGRGVNQVMFVESMPLRN
jgi:hypothetical protein